MTFLLNNKQYNVHWAQFGLLRAVMDSSFSSGLTNIGSNWFANATLKIIFHIPLLPEYTNKHEECSKSCYCQKYHNDINIPLAILCCICLITKLKSLCIQEGSMVIQPTARSTIN